MNEIKKGIVQYCDLRYTDKNIYNNDDIPKYLESIGWKQYHKYVDEELNIYNKFYEKRI